MPFFLDPKPVIWVWLLLVRASTTEGLRGGAGFRAAQGEATSNAVAVAADTTAATLQAVLTAFSRSEQAATEAA